MRIGILETGRLMPELADKHGDYPTMFQNLLLSANAGLRFETFAVLDGHLPPDPYACDGWVITGSAHGVYEDHDWIPPLEVFCRDVYASKAPLIGVCFGHQIVAKALGGTVIKVDRGWGAGLHRYEVKRPKPWMVNLPSEGFDRTDLGETNLDGAGPTEEMPRSAAIIVSHQDQVVEPPPGAEVLGGNDFCPFGLLQIGETILTMQFHPEMSKAFSSDLIDIRRPRMGDAVSDAAKHSLDGDHDQLLVAQWMTAFLAAASTSG